MLCSETARKKKEIQSVVMVQVRIARDGQGLRDIRARRDVRGPAHASSRVPPYIMLASQLQAKIPLLGLSIISPSSSNLVLPIACRVKQIKSSFYSLPKVIARVVSVP